MHEISHTQKIVSFFMILMLSTGLAMFSVEQNAQGYTTEAKGRLYYQAAFESFGTEPATLPKSLTLLGAGAKWAAGNGTRALLVDWYDNYLAHYNTDGINWGPWPSEEEMKNVTFSISYVLNQSGLNVELAGDIPSDLSGYDLVVLSAYWAVEPKDCSLIENYLANGGGVVLLVGIPEYFRCYCKDLWTYLCPTSNESSGREQWMGFSGYANAGGDATVTVNNPFETSLVSGDVVLEGIGGSYAAVSGGDAQVIATWDGGLTFACAHEYVGIPETPPPIEIPQGNLTLPPSMTLFAGGAKWAAGNGTNVLYVDWYSNWMAHWKTDGIAWGPWPEWPQMKNWTESIGYALNQSGLNVQFAADIPANLSGYDLVVLSAYWAVEPKDCSLIENYLANGGGVVLLVGIPEYFRCYCKDWWTYRCPISNESLGMEQWFGNGTYVNSGGDASITVDNPFGTNLKSGDILMQDCGGSNAAVVGPDAHVVATWGNGNAFAFTREYGQGRLYYQAAFESLDPPNKPGPIGDVAGEYNGVIQGIPDGKVDMRDISYLIQLFNTRPDSPKWNPMADINGDNIINMREIATAILHFNEHN